MRRGHALWLMLTVIVATTTAFAVFFTQLSQRTMHRRQENVRVQSLWLARSAVTAGLSSPRVISTELGPMAVSITRQGARTIAQVATAHALATVTRDRDAWDERFEAR